MECIDCVYYRRYGACMEYNLRGICKSFKKRSETNELHNMGTTRRKTEEKVETKTAGNTADIK